MFLDGTLHYGGSRGVKGRWMLVGTLFSVGSACHGGSMWSMYGVMGGIYGRERVCVCEEDFMVRRG